jgi:hypothetical protein
MLCPGIKPKLISVSICRHLVIHTHLLDLVVHVTITAGFSPWPKKKYFINNLVPGPGFGLILSGSPS